MPRLKFQQASQQLAVPQIAAPAQLRGGQIPNVMQFLQYDIAEGEAVSNFGKVASKAADKLFDAYIYDLDRGDRVRRRDENDVIDKLVSNIKTFSTDQNRDRVGEYRDRSIPAEDFEISVEKERDDQIETLLNNDLVQAHIEEHGLSKNQEKKFKSRLKTSLFNGSRIGTDLTIGRKFKVEDQQLEGDYVQAITDAKQIVAQAMLDKGIAFKAEYGSDSEISELTEDINAAIADASIEAKNTLPERLHARIDQELNEQFITGTGKLMLWTVNQEIGEKRQNELKDINFARRSAAINFRNYARESQLDERLKKTTDPKRIKEISQEIVSKVQKFVNAAAAEKGITDKRDIEQIGQDLQEIAGQTNFAIKGESVSRFLQLEDEQEREGERLKALDEDALRGEARIKFNDEASVIYRKYNDREIDFEEAQSQLNAVSASVTGSYERVVLPGQEALSKEDKLYNRSIRQSVDGIRSSMNLQMSQTEGARDNSLSEEEKSDQKRMDAKRLGDTVDDAAIAYRRKLVAYNSEMQNNPSSGYTMESVQKVQEQLLFETLDEFAPREGEASFRAREDVKRQLSKIRISREEQVVHSTNANQIRIKAGGQMEEYLTGLREKRKELSEQVEKLEISPIEAGEQLQGFAQKTREGIAQKLKESNDTGSKAIAEDFNFAAEHRITVPSMVAGFVSEMDTLNVKRTKSQDKARADDITGMTGDISTFQQTFRTYEKDDPRLEAIENIYRPSIGTIYEEGEYKQIIDGYGSKIDSLDANNLLLKGDKESLQLGIKLLQDPKADGAGFPSLQGSPRRVLLNQFKTGLEQLSTNDRIGLQMRLDNHFLFASSGSENFNPDLLETLQAQGEFNDEPKLNQRMYETAKSQQKYSLAYHSLTSGTEENLPPEFEPDKPLHSKSDAAISKIVSYLEPQNFMKKELGSVPKDSVNLKTLSTQFSSFQNSISKIQQDREDNPSRTHNIEYLAALSPEALMPQSNDEAGFLENNPELWTGQVFNSNRIDHVTEGQRRVQPLRIPLFFDDDQIENVNASWERTKENPLARANLIIGIKEQSGKHFPEVMRQLDGRSDIKISDQIYADYTKKHIIENIHAGLQATNKELYSKVTETDDVAESVKNDLELNNFTSAFASDTKVSTQMQDVVVRYALNLMSKNPKNPPFEEAFTQAKQDLIFSKYTLVPGNYGSSHFLIERKDLNVLLLDDPIAIKDSLNSFVGGLKFNRASRRAVEDNQSFIVGKGDGSYFLFGSMEGKQTPLQTEDGEMISITTRELNKIGLEHLKVAEEKRIKSASTQKRRPRSLPVAEREKFLEEKEEKALSLLNQINAALEQYQ